MLLIFRLSFLFLNFFDACGWCRVIFHLGRIDIGLKKSFFFLIFAACDSVENILSRVLFEFIPVDGFEPGL
jgi:hypothetical protein